MSKPQPRLHVVFDLDDTLYSERQFAISGFRACERWLEQEHGVTEPVVEAMTRLLDDGHMRALFEIVLAERMPGHSPHLIEPFIDVYRLHDPEIALYEDAAAALDHFEARAPIALITDGQHEVQSRKVRALGLESRFAHIVYTSALGGRSFSKPHPRAYEVVEERLGKPGDRYLYVGDNPAKDFVTPNARGWTSVQVLRPQRIHSRAKTVPGGEAHVVMSDLVGLPDLVAQLEREMSQGEAD